YSVALNEAQRAVELGYEYGHIVAYQALSRLGEFDRAEVELRRGLKHDSIDPKFIEVLMAAQRHSARSEEAIKAVAANLSLPDQVYTYAELHAYGEVLDTFGELQGTLLYLSLPVLWDTTSTELRRGARFNTLVREQRLLEYWIASKQWPDSCQPAGDSIECDVIEEAHP
ncbi:MAG: hypothetical protein ACREO9_04045, partial [Lysobacterales bacterium]